MSSNKSLGNLKKSLKEVKSAINKNIREQARKDPSVTPTINRNLKKRYDDLNKAIENKKKKNKKIYDNLVKVLPAHSPRPRRVTFNSPSNNRGLKPMNINNIINSIEKNEISPSVGSTYTEPERNKRIRENVNKYLRNKQKEGTPKNLKNAYSRMEQLYKRRKMYDKKHFNEMKKSIEENIRKIGERRLANQAHELRGVGRRFVANIDPKKLNYSKKKSKSKTPNTQGSVTRK